MADESVNCKHEGCEKEIPAQEALNNSQDDLCKCPHCGWFNKWKLGPDNKLEFIEARPGMTAWDIPKS